MEKIYRRKLKREGINRIGCMSVFISIFGSNQKRLLMDNKRASKIIAVNEKKPLTCLSESSQESVEKLTEEEMLGKNDINVSIAGDEHVKKNEVCENLADESEEKFSEIIKRLIAQKEGEIQTCKDLLVAFHVLGSEEDTISKKISHKDAKSLGDFQREEEEEKPEVVSKQKAERKSKFFSRKWKSQERKHRAQVAKTIVVLKSGPNSLDVNSSSGPHSTGNKSKNRRTLSRFLIGLIKRRRQSFVGKKSCDVPVDRSQGCCMQGDIQSNTGKHVSAEEESLCNERMKSVADKDTVHASEDSKKVMSSLYIAAKKHLSEMLANGDRNVSLPDKEVKGILGKILSLPEFSSPTDSTKLTPAHDLLSHLDPRSQKIEKPKILQYSAEANDLTDEDSYKYDEALFTIDGSVPRGYRKETENIDKTEIDPISNSSVSKQVEYVDESVLEFREDDEDEQSLKKEMFNQTHSLTSPPESPASFSVRMTDCKETTTDVQGKLSPVSVLEPLFTDDDSSPTTSTRFSSAEMRMQPLCIRFDETDSPKPDSGNTVKKSMDDKELTLAYIGAVVKTSGLSWEKLLTRPVHSEQLLEPELTDDIVFCSTPLCDNKNLLYDCINEVLIDFCGNEFNPGPWISFLKPEVQLISDMEIAAKVAKEGVYWHLLPLPSPHTLDQIVRKDMARAGSWMDLRFEISCIGSYTTEMILDEIVEEIIRSCRGMVQAEPMKDGNNTTCDN